MSSARVERLVKIGGCPLGHELQSVQLAELSAKGSRNLSPTLALMIFSDAKEHFGIGLHRPLIPLRKCLGIFRLPEHSFVGC